MEKNNPENPKKGISRRAFLHTVPAASLAATLAFMPSSANAAEAQPHWAMLIDLRRCIGCQACTIACQHENMMPEGVFRTVVALYAVALEKEAQPAGMHMLPRLCNHCDSPPCVGVCPTGATFKREDGIVVVNAQRCVGCSYCIQACPYDARFVNHRTNKTDKCTFCLHRIQAGLLPACVETCVGESRIFGNINDPNSEIVKRLRESDTPVRVLQEDMETKPQVFYIGLDERLDARVDNAASLLPRPRA